MTSTRRFRRALTVLAFACGLSACQTTVDVHFDVTGPTSAATTVNVTFTGAAADAATGDIEQVRDVIAQRAGVDVTKVHVTTGTHQVVLSVSPSFDAVASNAALTGVHDAVVGPPPAGHGATGDVALSVAVVNPTGLADAVRAAVAAQPDAGPLADATLGSTNMSVTVRFAGGVHEAYFTATDGTPAPAVQVIRTTDTATFVQPLSRAQAGEFVVIGDPTEPATLAKWGRWIAFAVLGSAILVWAALHDRRRRRIH